MGIERLSVFLLPAPADAARLQPVLDALASRLDGPRFPAHVTVYAGTFDGAEALVRAAERLARTRAPPTLAVEGLAVGDTYTKCLFARLGPVAAVRPLTEALRPLARPPRDYRLDPHLSLLYGTREAAEAGRAGLAPPLARIRCDRLAVNRSPGRSVRPEVVEAWERLAEATFAGPVDGR